MGTRGLTGFIVDGKWYATYNHFDSYPSGLGQEVLDFCKSITDWDKVRELVHKVTLVNQDNPPTADQIAAYVGYADLGVSTRSTEEWYVLLRDLQGVGILEKIADNKVWHMIDDHTFIGDSLFCEWAYIIDLDKMRLRVYKGFQHKPFEKNVLPDGINFDSFTKEEWQREAYYPCKLIHSHLLTKLPEIIKEH